MGIMNDMKFLAITQGLKRKSRFAYSINEKPVMKIAEFLNQATNSLTLRRLIDLLNASPAPLSTKKKVWQGDKAPVPYIHISEASRLTPSALVNKDQHPSDAEKVEQGAQVATTDRAQIFTRFGQIFSIPQGQGTRHRDMLAAQVPYC